MPSLGSSLRVFADGPFLSAFIKQEAAQLIISGLFAKVNFFQPNRKLVKRKRRGWQQEQQRRRLRSLRLASFCTQSFTCGHERPGAVEWGVCVCVRVSAGGLR